jgi:hypothetical protein
MKTQVNSRNRESGYALLFVYMMAAVIAIGLYMEVPRVAFEAQRDKEQLLIDRGEQYKRAIQLYVRKFNRFPADMQALENTQNIRFLRKQYTDPLTGKSDWRIVHVGPGGVFTDSKVYGTQKKKDPASAPQTFITELQPIGGGGPNPNQSVNLATRRRPSDDSGAPGDPNNPQQNPSGGQNPSAPGGLNGPVMVLPDGRIVPATSTGVPATQNGQANGQGINQPPAPGGPLPGGVGYQPGSANPNSPLPGQQGQPGFQTTPNGGPPTSAANLINQILTTPRPGGLNGTNPTAGGFGSPQAGGFGSGTSTGSANGTAPAQNTGGQVIGGGIAGVASKVEQDGIKTYNGRTSYDEWEFVYDMSKDPMRGGNQGLGQQPAQQPGQPAGQTPASPFGSPQPPAGSSTPSGTTGTPN